MGGAVKKVSNTVKKIPVVGGIAGGAIDTAGGLLGGVSDIAQGNAAFKGATRRTNKEAFEIEGSKAREKQLDDQRKFGRSQEKGAFKQQQRARKQQQGARQIQTGLARQLQQQAAGKGPSLAEAQMKRAGDRALAQQLGAAAAQRGGNQAALQRQLARGQASQAAQIAQDAGQARIQEQLAARQQLAGVGQSIRSQDQALRAQDIGLQQQGIQRQQQAIQGAEGMARARQQAQANLEGLETDQFLAAQGLTASSTAQARAQQGNMIGGLMNIGGSLLTGSDKNMKKNIKKYAKGGKVPGKAEVKGDSEKNDTVDIKVSPGEVIIPRTAVQKGEKGMIDFIKKLQEKPKKLKQGGKYKDGSESEEEDKKEEKKKKDFSHFANIGGSDNAESQATGEFNKRASGVRKYSDKDSKKKKSSEGPQEFLDALKAYSYEYKDSHKDLPEAGKGKHLGVMAQDLEKVPFGKSMVKDTPKGKMVDYGKGFGAILAAQAHLNERLKSIESKKKKKKA